MPAAVPRRPTRRRPSGNAAAPRVHPTRFGTTRNAPTPHAAERPPVHFAPNRSPHDHDGSPRTAQRWPATTCAHPGSTRSPDDHNAPPCTERPVRIRRRPAPCTSYRNGRPTTATVHNASERPRAHPGADAGCTSHRNPARRPQEPGRGAATFRVLSNRPCCTDGRATFHRSRDRSGGYRRWGNGLRCRVHPCRFAACGPDHGCGSGGPGERRQMRPH